MKDDHIVYKVRRKIQYICCKIFGPEFVSKIYFRHLLGYKLDLKNPTTFNEKIQWLKIYEWPKNKESIICSDKYLVREFLSKRGYSNYLNDIYFSCDSLDDIDWDNLPKQFVLKCNHGCAYNIICPDKDTFNKKYAKKKLKKWLKEDFGFFNAELHYNKIPKKIICEKFLGGDIKDYKFYCFNGNPRYMYIATGFGSGVDERISFFDLSGRKAPFQRTDYKQITEPIMPKNLDEMIRVSKELSKDFAFVRVDFFEVNDRMYFSELTFTPCGGLMKISPIEWDLKLGELLDISKLMLKNEK